MYYVAVDTGCIECGEETSVLGIFTDKDKAQQVLGVAESDQRENWSGQHSFEIFEIDSITTKEQ